MDITPLFKACIKTVKTRKKTLGDMGITTAEKRRPERPKCNFQSTACELSSQMTRLRDVLLECRSSYLTGVTAIPTSPTDDMTESAREQLDAGAQKLLHTCAAELREFRARNSKNTASEQTREYQNAVIEILDRYLKSVCKIHSELKALRVQRALEVRKLSRLEPSTPRGELTAIRQNTEAETARFIDEEEQGEELSPEELQVLMTENMELHSRLDSLSEEVKYIESKVVHIAQLQEIFTEKVLQQESEVERVAGTVLSATENVREANQQIQQAIQRNAGLRVYVLFFLLVMSFSLLFLDWYND